MILVGDEDKENVEIETKWYDKYYIRTHRAIQEANEYTTHNELTVTREHLEHSKVKLRKLLSSDYRNYFKWKKLFEKYMNLLDEENKYYYLLNHTKGEANKTNKKN